MTIKALYLLALVLASNQFFSIVAVPDFIVSALNRAFVLWLFVALLLEIMSAGRTRIFWMPVLCVMAGMVLNTAFSWFRNDSSLLYTFMAYLPFFYILIYVVFLRMDADVILVENLVVALAITYAVLYLVQMAVFPIPIISAANELVDAYRDGGDVVARGTMRFRGPGGGLMMLGYFIALNRYLDLQKIMYVLVATFLLLLLFLGGFRSLVSAAIVSTLLMAIGYEGFSRRTMIRILGFITVAGAAIMISGKYDIILAMIDETKDQNVTSGNYVRWEELRYFVFEFPGDALSYIFGSGYPAVIIDKYSSNLIRIATVRGYYWQDIGLIGLAVICGPMVSLGMIFLPIVACLRRIPKQVYYGRYFLIYLVFGSITSMEMFRVGVMGAIGVVLFLVEKSYAKAQRMDVV